MTESYLIRLNKVIAEPAFRIAWSVTKTFLETFKAERAAKLAGEKVAAVE